MIKINQLLGNKFSLIPLKKDTKIPIVKWKKYQYKRAERLEVWDWYLKYGDDINIGIVCGLSKLGVIDADNINQLPTLEKMVPEIWETCRVKTKKEGHYQFYFSTNGNEIRSTNKLFGLEGIELRSKGRYVVAVGSVVSGVRYKYERPLRALVPLPKIISDEYKKVGSAVGDVLLGLTVPKLKARCVSQILNYDLPVGQRKLAYHIAYCKMRQEGHKKDYAIYVCKEANKKISLPLRDDEFDFGKIYWYGCPKINEELDFVNCSFCQVRGGKDVQSLQMRSIHKLKGLTNSQRAILSILDTYFKGELPTIYEIQKYSDTNINYYTIKNALEVLKEKGII